MSGKSHPGNQAGWMRQGKIPPSMLAEVALTVRLLRWLSGWTQKELAARSGVAESSICRYEGGSQVPSPQTLARLCGAVDIPVAVIDGVLRPALREVLTIRAGIGPGGFSNRAQALADEWLRALAVIFRPQLELMVHEILASSRGPWAEDRQPSESDRQEAAELWAVLRDSSRGERELLLEETREYRGWAVCELACEESLRAASQSVERALEYAELAVEIARLAPGEDRFRQRLQGYAEAHLANARRVQGKLREAEAAFERARALWEAGASGDSGLLSEARIRGLEASLCADQRAQHDPELRFAEEGP
jgi:transcriptional regulator with XRE-family HTH domain